MNLIEKINILNEMKLEENTYAAYEAFVDGILSEEEMVQAIEEGLISETVLDKIVEDRRLDANFSNLAYDYKRNRLDQFGDKDYSGYGPYLVRGDRIDFEKHSNDFARDRLKNLSNKSIDMLDGAEITKAMKNRAANLAKWHEDAAKKREEKIKNAGAFGRFWHNMKKEKYENLARRLRKDESNYDALESSYRKGMNADAVRNLN